MAFTNVSDTIDGVNILIQVDGKEIGLQTDGSISIERETKEVKFKTANRSASIWKQKTAGMIGWNVSQSAYWLPVSGDAEVATFRDLFEKMTAATNYEVAVVLEYKDGNAGSDTLTYTGQAILTNLEQNLTNSGEDLTFSCSLEGTGALVIAEAPSV